MRHYIDVVIPEKKEKRLLKTTCDICGKEASAVGWGSSTYDVDETEIELTVKHKDGENYPEHGSGTEFVVDICPDCFKNKLMPFLDSIGCKAKRETWEW